MATPIRNADVAEAPVAETNAAVSGGITVRATIVEELKPEVGGKAAHKCARVPMAGLASRTALHAFAVIGCAEGSAIAR